MYDRILVPTDGSRPTAESVKHAATLARAHDAVVHVLYVVDRRRYRAATEDTKEEIVAALEEEGERAIDDAVTRLADDGVETVSEIREGIPYKTVLAYAEEADIDVIVIGTHGRTGRDRRVALGSVTERVVQNAETPVLVVNTSDEE